MRQLVYTMFISHNRASFHLWWKENLLKHQKVSKYYESGCNNLLKENVVSLYTRWKALSCKLLIWLFKDQLWNIQTKGQYSNCNERKHSWEVLFFFLKIEPEIHASVWSFWVAFSNIFETYLVKFSFMSTMILNSIFYRSFFFKYR